MCHEFSQSSQKHCCDNFLYDSRSMFASKEQNIDPTSINNTFGLIYMAVTALVILSLVIGQVHLNFHPRFLLIFEQDSVIADRKLIIFTDFFHGDYTKKILKRPNAPKRVPMHQCYLQNGLLPISKVRLTHFMVMNVVYRNSSLYDIICDNIS